MLNTKLVEPNTIATFGQRKIAPRACIVDEKRHIRTFLGEALEELGFIACECSAAIEFPALLDQHLPDLVVLGMPHDGIQASQILNTLIARQFVGKVLL